MLQDCQCMQHLNSKPIYFCFLVSDHACIYPSSHLFIYLFTNTSVHLSIYLTYCLYIHICLCMWDAPICLPIYLSQESQAAEMLYVHALGHDTISNKNITLRYPRIPRNLRNRKIQIINKMKDINNSMNIQKSETEANGRQE